MYSGYITVAKDRHYFYWCVGRYIFRHPVRRAEIFEGKVMDGARHLLVPRTPLEDFDTHMLENKI
jgi:hypothetical protein